VSKGTLYLYYPSKEELFKAVVRHNLSSLIAEGQEMVRQLRGQQRRVAALLIQTWWQRFGSTPAAGIHKVILAEVRNFPELAQFYTDEVILPADRCSAAASSAAWRVASSGRCRCTRWRMALIAPLIFMAVHRHSFGCCPVHGAAVPRAGVQRRLPGRGGTGTAAPAAPAAVRVAWRQPPSNWRLATWPLRSAPNWRCRAA
jgi:AcrR family transcriptional regulator